MWLSVGAAAAGRARRAARSSTPFMTGLDATLPNLPICACRVRCASLQPMTQLPAASKVSADDINAARGVLPVSCIIIPHSSTDNDPAIAVRDWLVGDGWNVLCLDLKAHRCRRALRGSRTLRSALLALLCIALTFGACAAVATENTPVITPQLGHV